MGGKITQLMHICGILVKCKTTLCSKGQSSSTEFFSSDSYINNRLAFYLQSVFYTYTGMLFLLLELTDVLFVAVRMWIVTNIIQIFDDEELIWHTSNISKENHVVKLIITFKRYSSSWKGKQFILNYIKNRNKNMVFEWIGDRKKFVTKMYSGVR